MFIKPKVISLNAADSQRWHDAGAAAGEPAIMLARRGFLTAAARSALPKIYTSDEERPGAATIHAAWTTTLGRSMAWALEFDGADQAFGYFVSPLEPDYDELTYFSLLEIGATKYAIGRATAWLWVRDENGYAGMTLNDAIGELARSEGRAPRLLPV